MKGRSRKNKKKMKRKKTANGDNASEAKSYSFRCFLIAALALLGFVAVVQNTSFFDSPLSPLYQVDSDDPTASTIVYTNDDGKQDQTDKEDQTDRNPALRGDAKTTENDDPGKQAATSTTTTTTTTTPPFVATLKDDGTFEEPPKGGQVLRILVLTYSRPKSLQRLLTSLNDADYRDDTIHLDIWIDRKTNQPPDKKTIRHSETTCKQWQYGTCTVHVRSKNVGLQVQWLTSWNDSIQKMKSGAGLTKDTKEIALILEDDLKVSKHYWRWLKFCHASYGSRKDFAGCTLQRASLCAKRCAVLKGGPNNAGSNFMYPLLGSWGYSPGAAHWTKFTAWTTEFIASGKKPYVNGLTPTDWYKSFESQGRCPGIRCMWTILHIKYVNDHDDRYTVYTKAPRGQSMASNYQEAGLHYGGSNNVADAPTVDTWDDRTVGLFKSNVLHLGWDGKLKKTQRQLSKEAMLTDEKLLLSIRCQPGQLPANTGEIVGSMNSKIKCGKECRFRTGCTSFDYSAKARSCRIGTPDTAKRVPVAFQQLLVHKLSKGFRVDPGSDEREVCSMLDFLPWYN